MWSSIKYQCVRNKLEIVNCLQSISTQVITGRTTLVDHRIPLP
jgi:hypothetical protein